MYQNSGSRSKEVYPPRTTILQSLDPQPSTPFLDPFDPGTLWLWSEHLLNLWEELLAIASSISFSEEKDSLIWELNSQDVYSVQTLYAIVSFRAIPSDMEAKGST